MAGGKVSVRQSIAPRPLLRDQFEGIQPHRTHVRERKVQVSLILSLLSHRLIFYCGFSYISRTQELSVEMPTGIHVSCSEWVVEWFEKVKKLVKVKGLELKIEVSIEGFKGDYVGRYVVYILLYVV